MYIFAVAGNPILHSRSPFLFSAAYNDDGSNYAYFRMHASNADQAMQTFAQLGLKAMNVTAPFKSDILNIVKNCSTTSAILAACNVVLRNNNDIAAHNTDPDGALGALHQANIDINGKTCLVLGAGGAGSAAAYALVKAGGMVTIANRSISKAQDIAHRIGCDFCSLTDISHKLTHSGIIVNTIPVDAIPLHNLTLTNVMLDAVYPNNVLQQKIENAGGIYISGDKWLLHQAMPAYR
jgi:shikimate dehydrogenase